MKKRSIAPKTRTCLITAGAFLLLALLLILGKHISASPLMTADRVSGPEERVEYLRSLGWEVDPASEEEQTIHLPEVFSPVYEDYNELQKQQGFDLSAYAGKDCTLYTYSVLNYPDESQIVLANLYLRGSRVIGGDIHSTNLDGFMIGLK